MNYTFKMQLITLITTIAFSLVAGQVHAQNATIRPRNGKIREIRTDMNQDKKQLNFWTRNQRAIITGAKVTGISGSVLTISKNGKTYTVNTTSTTIFRRRFWGKSSISEISINDIVNVRGPWTDTTDTAINATFVRDISIQKRYGVFFGTVTSTNGSGFVMQTINRGVQTVTVNGSTKFTNRQNASIVLSNINVGDKVRVSGTWDWKNSTITEVVRVKDFTIPTK